MTIVNVRGTHGSGKSTIMRKIIERYKGEPITRNGKKILGYACDSPFGVILIVGSYHNECGGCDGIQPYANIWPRVVAAHDVGYHVLFEGALVSNSYGNIGKDSEVYGDQFVFAFLDTPLEQCIDRIRARRLAKGNTKPFDPNKSVVRIFKSNESVKRKAIEFGRRVVTLDNRKAVAQVLGLLNASKQS